jgi:acyl carrier protein
MHDNRQYLISAVTRLFAEQLHIEVPSPESDLIEAGAIDSLSLVELLVQIERAFGVTVSMDDLDLASFRTVERIAQYVASRLETADVKSA